MFSLAAHAGLDCLNPLVRQSLPGLLVVSAWSFGIVEYEFGSKKPCDMEVLKEEKGEN